MRDLLVLVACTGQRLGDVCRLRWQSVDMAAGIIELVPAKSRRRKGEAVYIPILPQARAVLESRPGRKGFVLPDALIQKITGHSSARMVDHYTAFDRALASRLSHGFAALPTGDGAALADRHEAILRAARGADRPRPGTKRQAAEIGQCHPRTLDRYARAGLLHPIKISARRVRYDLNEVERLFTRGAAAVLGGRE